MKPPTVGSTPSPKDRRLRAKRPLDSESSLPIPVRQRALAETVVVVEDQRASFWFASVRLESWRRALAMVKVRAVTADAMRTVFYTVPTAQ
jgi:hypothetical protein